MPNGIATQDFLDRRLGPRLPVRVGGVSQSTGRTVIAAIMRNYRLSQGIVLERYAMPTLPATQPHTPRSWHKGDDGRKIWE